MACSLLNIYRLSTHVQQHMPGPENKVKGAGAIAYSKYVFAEFIISGFCIDISAELNAALGLYHQTNERASSNGGNFRPTKHLE